MYVIQCTLYNVRHTMYVVQSTSYNIRHTMYVKQCTSYNVRRTMYIIQCTSYNVRRTLYVIRDVLCTLLTVNFRIQIINTAYHRVLVDVSRCIVCLYDGVHIRRRVLTSFMVRNVQLISTYLYQHTYYTYTFYVI